jgi:hypothetical protein
VSDDDRFVSTTSNLDPISRFSNSEVGVLIRFIASQVNREKLNAFVGFVRGLSTDINSAEYQRMLQDPDAKTMLRKLSIYKALAKNLGLLHLL